MTKIPVQHDAKFLRNRTTVPYFFEIFVSIPGTFGDYCRLLVKKCVYPKLNIDLRQQSLEILFSVNILCNTLTSLVWVGSNITWGVGFSSNLLRWGLRHGNG